MRQEGRYQARKFSPILVLFPVDKPANAQFHTSTAQSASVPPAATTTAAPSVSDPHTTSLDESQDGISEETESEGDDDEVEAGHGGDGLDGSTATAYPPTGNEEQSQYSTRDDPQVPVDAEDVEDAPPGYDSDGNEARRGGSGAGEDEELDIVDQLD